LPRHNALIKNNIYNKSGDIKRYFGFSPVSQQQQKIVQVFLHILATAKDCLGVSPLCSNSRGQAFPHILAKEDYDLCLIHFLATADDSLGFPPILVMGEDGLGFRLYPSNSTR
jgi:hypothetical protein